MNPRPDRRRFVQLLGTAAVLGVAGCVGDSDQQEDPEPEPDAEDGNPGNDQGDPSDGADGGNGGTDGDQADSSDGSVDDGEGTDEDQQSDEDEQSGEDGQAGEQAGDDGESEGSDGESDDGGTTGSPRLGDVFVWEDSFVMEFQDVDGFGTWRFHEGDSHLTWTGDGETFDMIQIEGTSYFVTEGTCYEYTQGGPPFDLFDPESPSKDQEEYVARGTTTIDGEKVYEFDVGDGIYYVSVNTGYGVRFEGDQAGNVVTFHSWGHTDPISIPDGNCIEQ